MTEIDPATTRRARKSLRMFGSTGLEEEDTGIVVFNEGDDVRVKLDAGGKYAQYRGFHGKIVVGERGVYRHKKTDKLWAQVSLNGKRTDDNGQIETGKYQSGTLKSKINFPIECLDKLGGAAE